MRMVVKKMRKMMMKNNHGSCILNSLFLYSIMFLMFLVLIMLLCAEVLYYATKSMREEDYLS